MTAEGSTGRDRRADERDHIADQRETLADDRERRQDARDAQLDAREVTLQREELRRTVDAEQRLGSAQQAITASREHLDRSWERVGRAQAALDREHARDSREQDDVDREVRLSFGELPPSSTVAERWRRLSGGFQDRAHHVAPGGWDRPAPCAGWTARDVVAHMARWMPALWFPAVGRPLPDLVDPNTDPAACWALLRAAVQDLLETPEVAQLPTVTRAGTMSLEELVGMTGLLDVLVHTWDLARATGQDDGLDPREVEAFLPVMELVPRAIEQALRLAGHDDTPVDVPPDADPQTRLLAFTGRRAYGRAPAKQG